MDVQVEALPYIYNAESIRIEPQSANDWELLEIHANELEAGSLLGQVCVVYPCQTLPIRLGRYGDIAWVKVLNDGFGDADNRELSSHLGFDETYYNEDDEPEGQLAPQRECLRLVADTEVIVSPKLRNGSATYDSRMPLCHLLVHPTLVDYSREMEELFHLSKFEKYAAAALTQCPPWFTVAVYPSTFYEQLLAKRGEMALESTMVCLQRTDAAINSMGAAIARIILNEDVPRGCIGESVLLFRCI